MKKIDDLGWVAEATYKVGGTRFGIRTNSEAFADWLEYALGEYRMKRWVDPQFAVWVGKGSSRRSKEFHILYRGTRTYSRTLHLPTLVKTLLTELDSLLFPKRRDLVFAAAAVLKYRNKHALIPTEVAYQLNSLGGRVRRSGVALPVEMFVAVDPYSGTLVPIPSKLNIPDDALNRLGELLPNEDQDDARVEVVSPIVPATIMLPGSRNGNVIEPVSPGAVLHNLAGRTLNVSQMPGDALGALASLVKGARCYATMGGPQGVLQALPLAHS